MPVQIRFKQASCVVHVSEAYVSPVTVTIPTEVSLESGGTYQFLPTVTPEDDELQITWTTENPEVASVDNNRSRLQACQRVSR